MGLNINVSGHILVMIIGTIISAGIVYIIQFFRFSLDYTRVENVQFEDDDYYYYVKAVPKINVTVPEINVKRINSRKGSDMNFHRKDPLKEDIKIKEETYQNDNYIK